MPQRILVVLIYTLNHVVALFCSTSDSPAYSNGSQPLPIGQRSDAGVPQENPDEINLQIWMEQIQSLEDKALNPRLFQPGGPRSLSLSYPNSAGDDLSLFYSFLSTMLVLYQPIFTKRFLDEVPRGVVCVLAGKESCGVEATLVRSLTAQTDTVLRSLVTSMRKQSCPEESSSTRSGEIPSLFSLFQMDDYTISRIISMQEFLMSSLVTMPEYLTDYLLTRLRSFLDYTFPPLVKILSSFMINTLQSPLDYLKIGLQFLIQVPSLNQTGQCFQGDVKQLLMWGMNHNVSWAFGDSILDIFFATDPPLCSYMSQGCPDVHSVQFTRSLDPDMQGPPSLPDCDQSEPISLRDTCVEVLLSNSEDLTALHSFCRALDSLTDAETHRVWRNGCYAARSLLDIFLNESDCTVAPPPPSSQYVRSGMSQLLCSYSNWSSTGQTDPSLVALCSQNDRVAFVQAICWNTSLVNQLVITDGNNAWLWSFCTNVSDVLGLYCSYEAWKVRLPDASLVSFCWSHDHATMERLLCFDLDLFMLIFVDPRNTWLAPDCASLEPVVEVPGDMLVADTCSYSQWKNLDLVSTDILIICVQSDNSNFVNTVCTNSTFLAGLLQRSRNAWLGEHCASALASQTTAPPVIPSMENWCNYSDWQRQPVDPSVVGFCWQFDQVAFYRNVCCNEPVLLRLTLEMENEWLTTVCADRELLDTLPRVCPYEDWINPTFVDMTDVALCAELDPKNFTQRVCGNTTVLQNLLDNLDNTWVLQHCANGSTTGGNTGGEMPGFQPVEQCQYQSWTLALPDAALLSMCWDHDRANFLSAVCQDAPLLILLSQEPSSVWVSPLCTEFIANQTKGRSGSSGNNTDSSPCLARDFVRRLNWSCSVDLAAACMPGVARALGVQLVLRCAKEVLQPRIGPLLTDRLVSLVTQAVTELVVVLVTLEENQLTSLHVTENIRLGLLESVLLYLEHETNFNNKRVLLQCFGKVLTSLMQTGRDVSSNGHFLIKEYFRIPLPSLKAVLQAVDITTARQILLYYSRNRQTLQLTEEYLQTMISVFFELQLARDPSLFLDMVPLLVVAKPVNILSLPPLQGNPNILNTVNTNINSLSLDQRWAFGKWFSKSAAFLNMTASPSFVTDTGHLIAYLPFTSFQHLTPSQFLQALDILLMNLVSHTHEQFVAQSILATYRNLTVDQLQRMGNMLCLAHPRDLLAYRNTDAFVVIQDSVTKCVSQGIKMPSELLSSLFLNNTDLKTPSSLSVDRLRQISYYLPMLGTDFLRHLTSSQLQPVLSHLAHVPFTISQSQEIVDKLFANRNLTEARQLLELGSLVKGVKVENILALSSDILVSALPDITFHSDLSMLQIHAITTKLWSSPDVSRWLDKLDTLLFRTPLLSVFPRIPSILAYPNLAQRRPWNTQQAKALFKEATKTKTKLTTTEFMALGTIASGVTCKMLRGLFLGQTSASSVRSLLMFLREQPTPLHTSLKTCIIEEIYHYDFYSELLGDLGAQTALEIPVSTIKKFSAEMMDTLRTMIIQDPYYFLRLPSIKQTLVVDKIIQRLRMYTGQYTEEEFRALGIMATFVADEVFAQMDRSFLVDGIEFLQKFCYSSNSKRDMVAQFLQESTTFGPVKDWKRETLEQVDRFVFFLPKDVIQQIPQALMTNEQIERLFQAQQQWEAGDIGKLCVQGSDQADLQKMFEKQQFVLQFFLGFLRRGPVLIPSCENLQATQPSAWILDSLTGMSVEAFTRCLVVMGTDPFLTQYELMQLLNKVKKIYGPVSTFPSSVISQLGRMAPQLSDEDLSLLRLNDLNTISALGAVNGWNAKQLSVLFSAVVNSTRLKPSQLDTSTLVALGYIVCGIKDIEMQNLNPSEFGKAALWLGQLKLLCSEEQMSTLVKLLTNSQAFGPASSWGTEVFIEIGTLAVGLPDLAMSALVKDQIDGITPLAVSLIPPKKFAVVFDHTQIRMFSYEQAAAVTESQRLELSTVQQTALAMVLTPWEDKPVDFRGRSAGHAICPSPVFTVLEVLLLLSLIFWPLL